VPSPRRYLVRSRRFVITFTSFALDTGVAASWSATLKRARAAVRDMTRPRRGCFAKLIAFPSRARCTNARPWNPDDSESPAHITAPLRVTIELGAKVPPRVAVVVVQVHRHLAHCKRSQLFTHHAQHRVHHRAPVFGA